MPAPSPLRVLTRLPAVDLRRALAGLSDWLRLARRPLPRGGTEMRLHAALDEPGCPICRVTQGSDETWISWFLHESHMEPEVLDQLTRSAGFCPAHGERLLREPSARTQIATVHRIVVQRLRARWCTERGFAGWAAGVVRAGGWIGPCPACRAGDEAVRDAVVLLAQLLEAEREATYVAAPARLCLPHLRLVAPHLTRTSLERVLQAHETALAATLQLADLADVVLAAGHHPGVLAVPPPGTEVTVAWPIPCARSSATSARAPSARSASRCAGPGASG